jgi:hypothetical protein
LTGTFTWKLINHPFHHLNSIVANSSFEDNPLLGSYVFCCNIHLRGEMKVDEHHLCVYFSVYKMYQDENA